MASYYTTQIKITSDFQYFINGGGDLFTSILFSVSIRSLTVCLISNKMFTFQHNIISASKQMNLIFLA